MPDGSTLDQYAVTGTRLRGEFPLHTTQTGTFTFTVAGITKTGYTFDPAGSKVLSNPITVGGSGGGGTCSVNCLEVPRIKMTVRSGEVGAQVAVLNETGSVVPHPTVEGTWTLPDGSEIFQSALGDKRGKAGLSVPVVGAGTYTFTVTNVIHGSDTYEPGEPAERCRSHVSLSRRFAARRIHRG